MKQYTQSPAPLRSNLVDSRAHSQPAHSQQIAILENRVITLSSTVELQSRQIRRLEAALHQLESRAARK